MLCLYLSDQWAMCGISLCWARLEQFGATLTPPAIAKAKDMPERKLILAAMLAAMDGIVAHRTNK